MKIKRIVLAVLFIILNIAIFRFSSQDGKTSVSLSDEVTIKAIDKYSEITHKEITISRKKELVKSLRPLVRKTAHFTLYFVMGLLAIMFIWTLELEHPVIYAIVLCACLAACDEAHQLFSAGRTAQVFDVVIDTAGSLVGIGLYRAIHKLMNLKKRTNNEF